MQAKKARHRRDDGQKGALAVNQNDQPTMVAVTVSDQGSLSPFVVTQRSL